MKKLLLSFMCVSAIFAGCTTAVDEPQPTPESTVQNQAKEDDQAKEECHQPDEYGVIDMQAVEAFKEGKAVATFEMMEYHIWDCAENTDNWFEVFDAPHESMFMTLGIQEGKIWRHFHDKGNPRLTMLHSAWLCYKGVTGADENIYIATPFEFDQETKTLELDGYSFILVNFKSDSFKLGWKNRVNKQKKGWFDSYEIYTYTTTEPIDFSNREHYTPVLSEEEACYYTYNKVRKYFGRYIDLRKYANGCEYDNPIIDLDYVKKCLDINFGH